MTEPEGSYEGSGKRGGDDGKEQEEDTSLRRERGIVLMSSMTFLFWSSYPEQPENPSRHLLTSRVPKFYSPYPKALTFIPFCNANPLSFPNVRAQTPLPPRGTVLYASYFSRRAVKHGVNTELGQAMI